jgi:hypothetical protein
MKAETGEKQKFQKKLWELQQELLKKQQTGQWKKPTG